MRSPGPGGRDGSPLPSGEEERSNNIEAQAAMLQDASARNIRPRALTSVDCGN